MLRTRFLYNLGYRSCSTFSSVLTLGKKSQLSDAKSNQSAEFDQDVQILPNNDLKKNNGQFRQTDYSGSSNDWDRDLSSSAKHGTHAATEERRDGNNGNKYNRNKTGKWRTGADWKDQGRFDRVDKDKWKQHSKSKWEEQGSGSSGKWDSRSTNWNKPDNDWESDENNRSKTGKWRTGADWKDQGRVDRVDKDKWKQHSKSKWEEQGSGSSGKWDSRSTNWNKPDNDWESDENNRSKTGKWRTGADWKDHGRVDRVDKDKWQQHSKSKWEEQKRHPRDQPWSPSQNRHDRAGDKPRGKRLRKKEKLGFIESEPPQSAADTEQLLYGLHPVSLALSAGRREVLRVYHRADAGPADGPGRLSRLLAECAARGVGTVPLPAAQLDRIAAGTGVHQGVCARVTPLLPRSVDELLAQAGCPPLASDLPPTAEEEDQRTAAPAAGSVAADVTRSETGSETAGTADTEHRPPVSVATEEKAPETGPPGRTVDTETRAELSAPELAAPVSGRRRVWLMLDQVQDPMNFGSIIRSSYFLGVDAVIIPDRNSCPLSPTVSKASAGTLEVFPVYSVPADSCRQLLQLLASRRWQLLAAGTAAGDTEQAEGAISAEADTLLIVGNEGRGVAPSLASLCRPWTVAPQRHLADGVESLNVGVATGILLSQLILAR